MRIGEAANQAGVSPATIRYYEEIGLIRPATRQDNGYRDYSEHDVARLRFLQRAKELGFTLEERRELLSLYQDRNRASADVKAIALKRMEEIDQRIAKLQAMRATLATLVSCCHGDNRPDCPIIDNIAGASTENPSEPEGENS